jgi:hypothetical protein
MRAHAGSEDKGKATPKAVRQKWTPACTVPQVVRQITNARACSHCLRIFRPLRLAYAKAVPNGRAMQRITSSLHRNNLASAILTDRGKSYTNMRFPRALRTTRR